MRIPTLCYSPNPASGIGAEFACQTGEKQMEETTPSTLLSYPM